MDIEVKINGETYIPLSQVPLKMRGGKHPSDICRVCESVNYRITNSRSKDGYRTRTKECLSCGYRWKTIETTVLPAGRPLKNSIEP